MLAEKIEMRKEGTVEKRLWVTVTQRGHNYDIWDAEVEL